MAALKLKKGQFFILVSGEGEALEVELGRAVATYTGKTALRAVVRDTEVPEGYSPIAIHDVNAVDIFPLCNEYEAKCFVDAEQFVAVRRQFGDPGHVITMSTLKDAILAAEAAGITGQNRTMLYALTADGAKSHLFNI